MPLMSWRFVLGLATDRVVLSVALLASAFGGTAAAQAEPPALRPGFGVPAERAARFEKLRSDAQIPVRSRLEVTPVAASRRRFLEADLVRYEDGVVILANRLDRKASRRLRRLGVPTITRFEDLRDHVIFEDRLYRVLTVPPTKQHCSDCPDGHLSGPDEVLLTRRVGSRVRLELSANAAGRFVVTAVTSVEK